MSGSSNEVMPRVGLLGTGTCRLSHKSAQTSGFVRCSESELLLIDVGAGVPRRLAELNLLQGISTLHIHISHLHIDHLIGIFPLLQGLAWSDAPPEICVRAVHLRCTEEVGGIFNGIMDLLGRNQIGIGPGLPSSGYKLHIYTYPNEADWEFQAGAIKFQSRYLPGYFNHGLCFRLDGTRYGFTCDATEFCPQLVDFLRGVDVGVFDCGHITNLLDADNRWFYDPALAVRLAVEAGTPMLVAVHHYLRDLRERFISEDERRRLVEERVRTIFEEAKAQGYRGQIKVGYDLMALP